jgi:hypothetical protein
MRQQQQQRHGKGSSSSKCSSSSKDSKGTVKGAAAANAAAAKTAARAAAAAAAAKATKAAAANATKACLLINCPVQETGGIAIRSHDAGMDEEENMSHADAAPTEGTEQAVETTVTSFTVDGAADEN